jgi:hypothetical protein
LDVVYVGLGLEGWVEAKIEPFTKDIMYFRFYNNFQSSYKVLNRELWIARIGRQLLLGIAVAEAVAAAAAEAAAGPAEPQLALLHRPL